VPSVKVVVDPQMLRWVRERAGLSVQALAEKVGTRPDKVSDWELKGELTLKQAEEVAKTTHVPFGYLYLDEPPVEELPIADFRTVGSKRIASPSLELRETIDLALARQDWYRNYVISNGSRRLDFIGSLQGNEEIVPTARLIRQRFALETASRSQTADWGDAFTRQRMALEQQGILVMRTGYVGDGHTRPLGVKEFRGFALSDEYAPLLFINGQDHRSAQMFTLMHELVHLWLGLSGIVNLNRTYAQGPNFETFCNAVAAEILVPEEELRAYGYNSGDITPLLVHFKVSRLVILRRLRDLQLMSQREFVTLYRSQIQQEDEEKIEKKAKGKDKPGGPPYHKVKVNRLGKPFVTAVLESTFEGRNLPSEAFRLLGVSSFDQVKKLAREVKLGNF